MALEVVRSAVELDHLYAKQDGELLDIGKDVILSGAIDNLGELSDSDLISLFFGDDNKNVSDTGLSPLDELSFSPCSDGTSSESYFTPSPDTMDFESNSSPEGFSTDDFAIDVDLEWLTTLDDGIVPVGQSPIPEESQSISVDIINEPTVTSTSEPIGTQDVHKQSYRKASVPLRLTIEENRLLASDGIVLPTDVALTKSEERVLKKVRRKIKNKQSAQESRKKKKDYVEGLEKRVQVCTEQNRSLHKKVTDLESKNNTLLGQLKQLQAMVASTHPSKTQAGTCLMVLILAFGLVMFPINDSNDKQKSISTYATTSVRSRTLLQVKEDYLQDEGVPTPRLNPNGSDIFVPPAIELEWEGEHAESLANINADVKNNDKEHTKHKERNVMRTERR